MKDFSPKELKKRLTPRCARDNPKCSKWVEGKVLFIGMGNTLRSDDGAGIALLERLKGRLEADFIDCGTVPENYLGKIVDSYAQTIVVLDAVDLGLSPGEVRILEIEDFEETMPSTHNISPSVFMGFLRERMEGTVKQYGGTVLAKGRHWPKAGSDIFMIGIQPKSTKMNCPVSEPVRKALDKIEKELIKCMN